MNTWPLFVFFMTAALAGGLFGFLLGNAHPVTPDGEDLRQAAERLRRENQRLMFEIESARAVREQFERECEAAIDLCCLRLSEAQNKLDMENMQ